MQKLAAGHCHAHSHTRFNTNFNNLRREMQSDVQSKPAGWIAEEVHILLEDYASRDAGSLSAGSWLGFKAYDRLVCGGLGRMFNCWFVQSCVNGASVVTGKVFQLKLKG